MYTPKRMFVALIAMAMASVALVLTPAGSARDAKVVGTPATYTDPTGDAKSAPDVAKVAMDLDSASGGMSIQIDFAGNEELSNDGAVIVAFDTDRNSGTGDQTGSEYILAIFSNGIGFLKWNGSDMAVFSHQPTILGRAPGNLVVALCSCDLGTQNFDFAVVGFRGNDIDIAPDNGASFPIEHDAVSIRSLLYSMAPLFPKAGKRFTVKIEGVRLEGTNEVVLPESFSCSAKLSGRALTGRGAGGCSWLLPKKARGKKLSVRVDVSYHGDSETFSQTYKVS
jgi:hypothetical protein